MSSTNLRSDLTPMLSSSYNLTIKRSARSGLTQRDSILVICIHLIFATRRIAKQPLPFLCGSFPIQS